MNIIDMVKLSLPAHFFTKRLSIQKLRYEEAEEIFYSYASKAEATRFMSWPTHQSIEDTRSFLRYAIQGWETGNDYSYSIRLVQTSRLIGSFGVINDDGKIQFGYILSPTQWGNGYATEVCKSMMSLLRRQPGVKSVQTFTHINNVASAEVLLKSGLVEDGRLSNWFKFVNQGNQARDCIQFTLPL